MTSHHEPIPGLCNLFAPTIRPRRCRELAGHEGGHFYDALVCWSDPAHCPECRGEWDGTEGKCVERDCMAVLRKRCAGCGLRAGEVHSFDYCASCGRVVCVACKRELEGRALCPNCLRVAHEADAGNSGRPEGAGTTAWGAGSASSTSPLDDTEEDHGWSEGRGHY